MQYKIQTNCIKTRASVKNHITRTASDRNPNSVRHKPTIAAQSNMLLVLFGGLAREILLQPTNGMTSIQGTLCSIGIGPQGRQCDNSFFCIVGGSGATLLIFLQELY